jgi:hypothetical protein
MTKSQYSSNDQMTNAQMSPLVIGACELVIPTEGRL